MKKYVSYFLALVLLLASIPTTAFAAAETVTVLYHYIKVDGGYQFVNSCLIGNNNYFKLRDIASMLSGTPKQFDVTWDGTKSAINLLRGKKYTAVGGELKIQPGDSIVSATPAPVKVYMDGKEIQLAAYTIGGNNYFKLRDLARAIDFGLMWTKRGDITIESLFPYREDTDGAGYSYRSETWVHSTQANSIKNWASVSPVQQFSYRNEGLAYAYLSNKILTIATPSAEWNIKMDHKLLGDVIADADGNFYVVSGDDNTTTNASVETTFISKYSPTGIHIKTTGFVGAASPWGDSDTAKTARPFKPGNCVSAISNGVLVNYHSKTRYDGHQSDLVIAVNLSDMSPHDWPQNTYSGHSFNQSVIYCAKTSDFLFASLGDAYARGVRVNHSSGGYGNQSEVLFHCYMEANANYDMRVVNQTFAQLGGLAETSKGVVLVGASARSIGEAAKKEHQNLFVQIFDPNVETVSAAKFIGGTTRSGATAFDINDKQNAPLTAVSDYGVRWLTDCTDEDVIAPQVVVADDCIVIFWTENSFQNVSNYYMVLAADGSVITPATSLGRVTLNSYETPVYHDGRIYWVSNYNSDFGNPLMVSSIALNDM